MFIKLTEYSADQKFVHGHYTWVEQRTPVYIDAGTIKCLRYYAFDRFDNNEPVPTTRIDIGTDSVVVTETIDEILAIINAQDEVVEGYTHVGTTFEAADGHNPVLQFVVEAFSRIDGRWYALAGGAWLVCTQPDINEGIKLKKGMVCFRDYWEIACYDDGCELAQTIRDNDWAGK